ncbi:hypothetical protein IW261DRAFT_1503771 [Armillaria novae-zelandiae]|uniref:Uncharacterized protein n=1 Tax=Armillaria novae-zelandiae TaxID=153914 RepID=A0AA39NXE2_9AGAR|nr:hypothetical protein IW261DRAFT_1503771 [Armillaria novae-zelandiae]
MPPSKRKSDDDLQRKHADDGLLRQMKKRNIPIYALDAWPNPIHAGGILNHEAQAMHRSEGPPTADWCCVVSDPIPERAKVRAVRFVTNSCDQGWVDEKGCKGTYDGSWTWFEAAIIRGKPWWLEDVSKGTPVDLCKEGSTEEMRSEAQAAEVRSDELDDSSRWHVGVNVTATPKAQRHTKVWLRTDCQVVHYKSMRGILGLEDEFVRLLEPGDRVALMARAMFPGWSNKVTEASIDVYFTEKPEVS